MRRASPDKAALPSHPRARSPSEATARQSGSTGACVQVVSPGTGRSSTRPSILGKGITFWLCPHQLTQLSTPQGARQISFKRSTRRPGRSPTTRQQRGRWCVGPSKRGGTIGQESTPLPDERDAIEGHHRRGWRGGLFPRGCTGRYKRFSEISAFKTRLSNADCR